MPQTFVDEATQALLGQAPEGEWADWYAKTQAAAQQSVRDFLTGAYLAPGQLPSLPAIRMALGMASDLRRTVNPAEMAQIDEAVKRYLPSTNVEMTPELQDTIMDYFGNRWQNYVFNPQTNQWIQSLEGRNQAYKAGNRTFENVGLGLFAGAAPPESIPESNGPKLSLSSAPTGISLSDLGKLASNSVTSPAPPTVDYYEWADGLSDPNPYKKLVKAGLQKGLAPTWDLIEAANDAEIKVRAARDSLEKPKKPSASEKKTLIYNAFANLADYFRTHVDYQSELQRPRTKSFLIKHLGPDTYQKLLEYASTLSYTKGPKFVPGMAKNPAQRLIEQLQAQGVVD